ncbi:MAG: LysR substrate-binding domain-containing protein [Hyphomicrobiales bacterium]|nr:LysR substrate-binding domain-containing protein [Hyphomicrobiales bacterium]
MDRLETMAVFAAVAEAGSFAAAARKLRVSPAAVTRAVMALEERLGARLLVRTTRSLRLTDAGARFLADASRILHEVQEAEDAAAGLHVAPRGLLSVTAPVLLGRMHVTPILRRFIDAYPHIEASALFVDRIVNIAEEGLDVAVRIGEMPDSSLAAVRVGRVRVMLVASPSYLDAHGELRFPSDLAAHRLVSSQSAATMLDWRFGVGAAAHTVRVRPVLSINNLDALIDVAAAGWAIARVLSYQVADHLADGRLRVVLADAEPPPAPVHVAHQEGRRASAKVRAFVDFAVDALRADKTLNGA